MTAPLTLDALKALIEELAKQQLEAYTVTLQASPVLRGKDVNDALWGTVSFSRMEVALLDSPLLQRLRYIRQRGAAHWVYPGSVHTRFEHLLGAMAVVRSMVIAFNQSAKGSLIGSESPPISESTEQVLRLAMILREAAQMAFSQVSEGALSELPEFAAIPKAFSLALRAETGTASEDVSLVQIVGYFLVQSEALRALLGLLLDREGSTLAGLGGTIADRVGSLVKYVSFAIIGRRIDDRLPLVHEIVSGPFDAECIDALLRDARFAGLPTLMDEQRLLQKLEVRRMPLEEMPDAILTAISDGGAKDDTWLFGVKASAAAVLDELQLARMLATSKVYQHPKVLAVEQMLRSAIESLVAGAGASAVLRLLFSSSDDAFLGRSAAGLAQELAVRADATEAYQRIGAVAELLTALRERRLWVRAFQFPEWSSALDMGREASTELELIRDDLRHVERGPVLMGKVRAETHRILDLIEAGRWSRLALDSLVSARSLEATSSETEVGRAYIIRSSQKSYQFSELLSARGSWLDHYNAGQPRDHVFCPPQIADAVFVAFERVARVDYDVRLPESSIEASKRDSRKIEALKRDLWTRGYWNQTPYDIRPMPARLKRPELPRQLASFYDLRTKYLAPASGNSIRRARIVATDITARDWKKRWSEHVAAIRRGSKLAFHKTYRARIGSRRLTYVHHKVMGVAPTLERIQDLEEALVRGHWEDARLLNMIPGGRAGLNYLQERGWIRDKKSEVPETAERTLGQWLVENPRKGLPAPWIAELWKSDDYALSVICGPEGRLSVEQVAAIRAMARDGVASGEILRTTGARSLDQVQRVIAGRTYARVPEE